MLEAHEISFFFFLDLGGPFPCRTYASLEDVVSTYNAMGLRVFNSRRLGVLYCLAWALVVLIDLHMTSQVCVRSLWNITQQLEPGPEDAEELLVRYFHTSARVFVFV